MTIVPYKIYRFNIRFPLKEIAEAMQKSKLPPLSQASLFGETIALNKRFEDITQKKDELWGTLAYEVEVTGKDIDGNVSKIKNTLRYRFVIIDGEREFLIVIAKQNEAGGISFWLTKVLNPRVEADKEYILLTPHILGEQIEKFTYDNHCTLTLGNYEVDIVGWHKISVSGSDIRQPPQFADLKRHIVDTPIVRLSIPENRYSIAIVKRGSVLDYRTRPPEEFVNFIKEKIFPILPR